MAKNLVIVESPAKAKTISRFLGADYKVLASMGHVRDLPKSDMGIDIEGDFTPSYAVSEDKKKVIRELKAELKKADTLWIATDEDREGEAIGWHLLHALKVADGKFPVQRIVFHEITESAIKHSIEAPRDINQNVVDAQQARRVLDRLVGYELSPLLWKKVRYGLSAGRVQSVAVRLVVDREREIEAFVPEEYWTIIADLEKSKQGFQAELKKKEGANYKVVNGDQADEVLKDLEGAEYKVENVEKKEVKRNPAPPFITSTLQQEASRKLGFGVKKTMMVAQRLYEGVDVGKGQTGIITYMRTDSVNLSNLALKAAKDVIVKRFGKEFALDSPRRYKGKKGAQEAHEAIRPVDMSLAPEEAAKFLDHDQARLYELIWKRTLACQMAQAILNRTSADISAKGSGPAYGFRATGQTVKFAGFMEVYMEGRDEGEEPKDGGSGEKFLPPLGVGDVLDFKQLVPTQHFTKPPPRYTEASLVKKLEAEGIGRPSTYAPTISTVITRGYIEKEGKTLRPTDLAMLVTDFLVEHFSNIVDYQFTADMEGKLDSIEEGEQQWVPMIRDFYGPFHKNIEDKDQNLTRDDVMKERVIGKDPDSGLDIVARHGRFGPYVQVGQFTAEEVKEMEEKPRRASLPDGAYFDTITLEEALKALSLPRDLGELDGELVVVTTGRYGPYLKVGKKNVSLPDTYDPYAVVLDDCKEIIKEAAELRKKMAEPIAELGKDPESEGEILIKNGRFGPYVTDGKTNVSIRKGTEPSSITFEQAVEMLEKKRKAPKRGGWGKKKK